MQFLIGEIVQPLWAPHSHHHPDRTVIRRPAGTEVAQALLFEHRGRNGLVLVLHEDPLAARSVDHDVGLLGRGRQLAAPFSLNRVLRQTAAQGHGDGRVQGLLISMGFLVSRASRRHGQILETGGDSFGWAQ
ncbi:hypothetical protein [Candidatus Poriferisocius sp.]|uniref:hypothetical protein n=1 Tax=Candidatus Poriferisocius sp. TaxID=3101276 RepID=UPI003B5AECF3